MKPFIILAIVSCVLITGCKSKSESETLGSRPIKVEVAVVGESQNNVKRSYVGEIIAQSETPLSFPFGGRITSIKVRNGSRVGAGQVIAMVDNSQQQNLLNSANAILRQAEDGYERVRQVHDQGGVSDVKWVEMETNLQKARSAAMSAQKNYDDCILKAPQGGLVNLNDVEVGEYLAPGQRLGSILSMNGMRAEFTVPENDIPDIAEGGLIQVTIPALNRTVNARISEKSLVSTLMVHAYTVRANIASSDAQDMLQGMVCKINIFESDSQNIIIPSRSVQTMTDGQSVWVVKHGRAERRRITLGEYAKNGVVVTSGLSLGDTIVTQGYQKLFDGVSVEYGK